MLHLRVAIATGLSVLSWAVLAQNSSISRTPVVVELFTSEGCSSCPPADALLAKLDRDQPFRDADVIVLGEHVDYWDNLGWHDRFSSHFYTQRQDEYSAHLGVDGVYTPQMIVDGTDQFVGNDSAHASRSIERAAQRKKIPLTLTHAVVADRSVSSTLSSPGPLPASETSGDVYVALVDVTDTTDVRKGENGGRRLQHAGVVRTMQRIGTVRDLGNGPMSFSLQTPGDANPSNMRVVAFIQQHNQGAILGSVSTSVTP